jgi:hypothetical protein
MGGCSSCGKYGTEKCGECHGYGKKDYGGFGISHTCETCGGSGRVCDSCKRGTAK